MHIRFLASAALLGLAAHAGAARAETTRCTPVTSLPAVISTQGVYCLTGDLSTAMSSGHAITINANNVILDCNDRKLGGLAGGAGTTAIGIRATARQNVTVRHCNVRGFWWGLHLDGSGHRVIDSQFDGNTARGIVLVGDGGLVRGNRVNDTGGSSAVMSDSTGIVTYQGVDILDNTVDGVFTAADGNSRGILFYDNPAGSITGNRVRGLVKNGAFAIGLDGTNSGRVLVAGNHVVGPGGQGSWGIFCQGGLNRLRDNTFSGFEVGLDVDCGDDGGNVHVP